MTDPTFADAQDEAYYAARDEAFATPNDPMLVSEAEYFAPTPRERAEFERMLDWDAWEGFGA